MAHMKQKAENLKVDPGKNSKRMTATDFFFETTPLRVFH